MWLKVRLWRLNGIRRGMEIGICLICGEVEELWHILDCEGVTGW
jgi:hypothetical protein